MSKPEDIPQDIWEKADAAFEAGSAGGVFAQEIISRAIMAERDRCAGIAFCAYQNKTELCTKIIRRIRSGEALVR